MGTLQIDNDIDSKALTSSKQIFARYRVYRELSGKLVNDELFGYIGEDTIKMVAKKFGLIKNKTLILNSDVELAILMNFCLFHYYGLDGKRAIDRYALNKLNVLQSDKKIMTLAMRESHFSILLVEEAPQWYCS